MKPVLVVAALAVALIASIAYMQISADKAKRKKAVEQAAVQIVPAPDETFPPIARLPRTKEEADAFDRRAPAWGIGALLEHDLFGMRAMWKEGFFAACEAQSDVRSWYTFSPQRTEPRRWLHELHADPRAKSCPEAPAPTAQPDPLFDSGELFFTNGEAKGVPSDYGDMLYALARTAKLDGVWFDQDNPAPDGEAPYRLHAVANGKRFTTAAKSLPKQFDVAAAQTLIEAVLKDANRDERCRSFSPVLGLLALACTTETRFEALKARLSPR